MKEYLLPEEGHFYKANLHAHSTVSDGRMTPKEIKEAYKAKGYSVVAFTDHEVMVDHGDLTDGDFLALKGYELAINEGYSSAGNEKRTYHLCLIATSPSVKSQVFFNPRGHFSGNAASYANTVRPYGDTVYQYTYSPIFVNRLVREATAAGFLVNYNHPHWSMQREEDYLPLVGLTGVEVFNGTCTAVRGSLDHDSRIYDALLKTGNHKNLLPIAADDNHNEAGFFGDNADSFLGFMMIKAKSLTYEHIIAALKNGDCYASSGPQINSLYVEGGRLYIEGSPVREIIYRTSTRRAVRRHKANDALFTEASFPLLREDGYFRLELVDEAGRRAYTPAYDASRFALS